MLKVDKCLYISSFLSTFALLKVSINNINIYRIMTTKEIIEIARQKGLKVENVENLGTIVYNFFDFNKAVKFAKEYNLEENIYVINQIDNKIVDFDYVVYNLDENNKGKEYYASLPYGFNLLEHYKNDKGEVIQFFKGDADYFQEVDIDDTLQWMKEEEKSEKEIEDFLTEIHEVKEKIENLSEGEFISKSCYGDFTDVLPKYLGKVKFKENDYGYVAVVVEYKE